MKKPFSIYGDWALHDELGDTVELTEEMTRGVLDRLGRWQKEHDLAFEYYLIDTLWFDPEGNYQQFKKPHWPRGFDETGQLLEEAGMKPGLWFDVNGSHSPRYEGWKESLSVNGRSYCLFDGPYAEGLEKALVNAYSSWGVRLFKLDFADFTAVTPRFERTLTEEEVYGKNIEVLRGLLRRFRSRFTDAVILAYNGYELIPDYINNTSRPLDCGVDPSWLEVFDYMYSGDPKPADISCISFRRSIDLYQDHMVYKFNFSGIPLQRIDDHGCMIGKTNTIYRLGKRSWRRSWIMTLARGSKKAHLHGNLHSLDDSDVDFLKRARDLYFSLYKVGMETKLVGGVPLKTPWHGFLTGGSSRGLLVLANSTGFKQDIELDIPGLHDATPLFSDAGVNIELQAASERLSLALAPEQMVLVGLGEMAEHGDRLGCCEDEPVPFDGEPIPVGFKGEAQGKMVGEWMPKGIVKEGSLLRISAQAFDGDMAFRFKAWKEGPAGKLPGIKDHLNIELSQEGCVISPYTWEPNRPVWSRCSWMTALYWLDNVEMGKPMRIQCILKDADNLTLEVHASLLRFRDRFPPKLQY